jgi:hypothetical protein
MLKPDDAFLRRTHAFEPLDRNRRGRRVVMPSGKEKNRRLKAAIGVWGAAGSP